MKIYHRSLLLKVNILMGANLFYNCSRMSECMNGFHKLYMTSSGYRMIERLWACSILINIHDVLGYLCGFPIVKAVGAISM